MTRAERFEGFPARTEYTPVPNPFFGVLLPQIETLAELKVTLHIFWALYRRKGYPRFIAYSELRGDAGLMSGLVGERTPEEQLKEALAAAVARGTLLTVGVRRNKGIEQVYFLNTEQDQRAIEKIENGEIELGEIPALEPAFTGQRPNIFDLYEQHIGPLTPMIAEDLKEAEALYPPSWIEDAFRESARLNKRSWRYINRILERWASEGKQDGRAGADSKEDISPKDYIRKYGHLTRR